MPISGEVSTAVGSNDRNTGVVSSDKKIPGEIYVVASWNDWLPTRLKTNKTLVFYSKFH